MRATFQLIGVLLLALAADAATRQVQGSYSKFNYGLRRLQALRRRHLVERHAARGLLHEAAGNLDRLAAFAGRREQRDRIVSGRGCRRLGREQIRLQRCQRRQGSASAAGCRGAEVMGC